MHMPSSFNPGETLLVGTVAYDVERVLQRPGPDEAPPREVVLLARCLSGEYANARAVIRCLEGPEGAPWRQRAEEGGRLAMRLAHPHLTRVWQVHSEPRMLHVVSEYLEGFDLQTVLSLAALTRRAPSAALACYLGMAITDALAYLHHGVRNDSGQPLGLIHRGVNPENIRLGSRGEVKLSGFDVMFSRLPDRRQTTTNRLRGELAYAAPEYVCEGQNDQRQDFFSLGMVLLELLKVQHPFDNPFARTVEANLDEDNALQCLEPSWLSLGALSKRLGNFGPEEVERFAHGLPEGLIPILKRALQREPARRYQRALDMRDALRACLGSLPGPYGSREAVAEVHELRALSLKYPRDANPLEQGVLPD